MSAPEGRADSLLGFDRIYEYGHSVSRESLLHPFHHEVVGLRAIGLTLGTNAKPICADASAITTDADADFDRGGGDGRQPSVMGEPCLVIVEPGRVVQGFPGGLGQQVRDREALGDELPPPAQRGQLPCAAAAVIV